MSPADDRFDPAAGQTLLLLGDAGGMVSPFNGEGISYAMESARCAAQLVDDAARATAVATAESLNSDGMRVLAVSTRIIGADAARAHFVHDNWDYTPRQW